LWRENGGNPHQILGSDARVAQRELKRSKAFPMLPDPLGEKNPFGDHVFAQFAETSSFP
jgi:hypothetical protein